MATHKRMSGLRATPTAAKKEIQRAVLRGRSLPGYGSSDVDDDTKAERRHKQWHEVTICMLSSIFDSEIEIAKFEEAWPEADVEDDEEEAFEDFEERLRKGVGAQVDHLVALRDSLPHYSMTKSGSRDRAADKPTDPKKVFVVHGHDMEALAAVERFLKRVGLTPVVLYKQLNKGKTIIEKFEKNAEVGYAIVLFTPDDVAFAKSTLDESNEMERRARQNVVLELGYFFGTLGRANVCPLLKGGVTIPSDAHGIGYVEMDDGGRWRRDVAGEMKAAGLEVRMSSLS